MPYDYLLKSFNELNEVITLNEYEIKTADEQLQ